MNIAKELGELEGLKALWSGYEIVDFGAKDLKQSCFTYTNDEGEVLAESDIDLSVEEDVDIMVLTEFINLTTIEKGGRWIKKKVEGTCLSADPEDCLVKCWVTDPCVFQDEAGRTWEKYGNLSNSGFQLREAHSGTNS